MSSFSRRSFLGGAAALGAAAASPLPPTLAAEPCAPLPRPIAALKSRKEQARPIGIAERDARLERARELMPANKLDAIMLMQGTSLEYYPGIRWSGGERL